LALCWARSAQSSGKCPEPLFANLADGATVEEFLDWFPGVEAWQVKAVLEHEVQYLESRVRHADSAVVIR